MVLGMLEDDRVEQYPTTPTHHRVFTSPGLGCALLLCVAREANENEARVGGLAQVDMQENTGVKLPSFASRHTENETRPSAEQLQQLKERSALALSLCSRFTSTFSWAEPRMRMISGQCSLLFLTRSFIPVLIARCTPLTFSPC